MTLGYCAARRIAPQNIVACDEGFNLPGKNPFESVAVPAAVNLKVCGDGQIRQASSVPFEAARQLGSRLQEASRGAAAVPEKDELRRRQGRCVLLRELRDPADSIRLKNSV